MGLAKSREGPSVETFTRVDIGESGMVWGGSDEDLGFRR